MNIQKLFIVLIITNLIMSCNQDQSGKINKSQSASKKIETQEEEKYNLVESNKMLNKAIKALNNVAEEYHWRDTHLLIQESQEAIKNSAFEESINLSKKIIQQSNLMNEQQEFANNNWQKFIPNMAKK